MSLQHPQSIFCMKIPQCGALTCESWRKSIKVKDLHCACSVIQSKWMWDVKRASARSVSAETSTDLKDSAGQTWSLSTLKYSSEWTQRLLDQPVCKHVAWTPESTFNISLFHCWQIIQDSVTDPSLMLHLDSLMIHFELKEILKDLWSSQPVPRCLRSWRTS